MTTSSKYLFCLVLVLSFVGCSTKRVAKSYETPQDTFFTWKQAARDLDIQTLLKSYARSARPSLEEELAKSTAESLKAMQEEAKDTNFMIDKVVYEDGLAYLRITRKKHRQSEVEVLTMVKEGSEWKLLP